MSFSKQGAKWRTHLMSDQTLDVWLGSLPSLAFYFHIATASESCCSLEDKTVCWEFPDLIPGKGFDSVLVILAEPKNHWPGWSKQDKHQLKCLTSLVVSLQLQQIRLLAPKEAPRGMSGVMTTMYCISTWITSKRYGKEIPSKSQLEVAAPKPTLDMDL